MTDMCEEIARMGKGMGNENRFRILQFVLGKPQTVGQIAKKVKLAQPAVSQHLKNLKSSNLVIDERRGQEVLYSANSQYMLKLLKNLSDQIETRKRNAKT